MVILAVVELLGACKHGRRVAIEFSERQKSEKKKIFFGIALNNMSDKFCT